MNRLKFARGAVTTSVILLNVLFASGAGGKSAPTGKDQLAFGVDMAKRGLWSEALFRFEQARLLDPGRVSILNNLAICYEAGGRFEEALATYREALRLAPENRVVKQNYSRFVEFYQGFRPRKATTPATAPAPVTPAPGAEGVAEPPAAATAPAPPPSQPPPALPAAAPAVPEETPPASSPPPAPGSPAPEFAFGGGR